MYDCGVTLIGLFVGYFIGHAIRDRRYIHAASMTAGIGLLFLIGCVPVGKTWNVDIHSLPECHVILSCGVPVSEWQRVSCTTRNTLRGFLATDIDPVLVYNPEYCTDKEARAIYEEEY